MAPALSVNLFSVVRLLVFVVFLAVTRTTHAQEGSELFSFDIGIGPALGSGRIDFTERIGAGYSANLGWRPATFPKRRAIFALNSTGFFLPFDEQTLCVHPTVGGPPYNPCGYAKTPDAMSIGALGGVAVGPDASAFRFMAGPAFFRPRGQDNTIGLQSRLDFARPITKAVSFVMWAQGMVIPLSTEDNSAKALQFGVGFRLR